MILTLLLAAAAPAQPPTLPVLKATLYRNCVTSAQRGAPPDARALIPQVCGCFVERLSRGKTAETLLQDMRRDQTPLGRQCIAETAKATRGRQLRP